MWIAEILDKKGRDVFAVTVGATVADAVRVLNANNVGAVVVVTPEMAPVGILSERDVVRSYNGDGSDLGSAPVSRMMTRALIVCGPDDDVLRAEDLMNRHRIRHLPVAHGGRLVGMVSMRDILEVRQSILVRANDSLRKGETSYRLLLSLSPDATIVAKDDRIVFANGAAIAKFRGRTPRTLVGVSFESVVHPEERAAFRARCAAIGKSTDQTAPTETRFVAADGGYFFGEQIVIPIVWDDEDAILISIRDVSERKRVEARLREARDSAELASRSKSGFLANMSHELRTPLNAIIGFSEILAQELYGPLPNDPYRQFATDILGSGRHLLALINDMLDLSKVEAGKMELSEEQFELADAIEGSVRFVQHRAAARGVTLTILPVQAGLRLRADPRKLKQVLINLLSNAVKFTPPLGRVSVATEIDRGLKIRITDSGVGMSADDIKTALEPFGQVRRDDDAPNEGTGLGLPLSKSIVELHGGALDIESAAGKGTTVTVSLPHERLAAEPVAATAAAQASR